MAPERLRAANVAAARFFTRNLHGAGATGPYDYLSRRGIASALHGSAWSVGFAPAGWTALVDHLRRAGFADSEIIASGLGIETRRHTLIDRFRDRVTFGIRDESGAVIAFTGRAAPGEAHAPRYLNSPATTVYDKSKTLFGLAEQRTQLDAGAVPVLVEGPLDAIAVFMASTDSNPLVGLSPCGTSLTMDQVADLARHTKSTVSVAFDADYAGRRATARSYPLLSREFREVRAAQLPASSDPAGLLQLGGPSGVRDALARTSPLADRVVDDVLARYADRLDNAEARVCALREVAATVTTFRPGDVARQASRVSALLQVDHPTVAAELADAIHRGQVPSTAHRTADLSTAEGRPNAIARAEGVNRHMGSLRR